MNKIFRLVWNQAKGLWMPVAEQVRSRGALPSFVVGSTALWAAVLSGALPAWAIDPGALPTGGSIVAGQGSIAQNGNRLTVTQGSNQLIANWNSFDIGAAASVVFQQPGASSVALNRIQGPLPPRSSVP